MTNITTPNETLTQLFQERAEFLGITTHTCHNHSGWQVSLVLDGHYADHETANEIAEYMRQRIVKALAKEGITTTIDTIEYV